MNWSASTREIGLALLTAIAALLLLAFEDTSVLRGLETASLDLRFRIRGVQPPGPEIAIVLVDDRSVDALGRWPLNHRLFAQALDILDRAGAKIVAFDLLFTQPEQSIPPELRAAAQAVAVLPAAEDTPLTAALRALAADDPDSEFEKSIRKLDRVLLPVAFAFSGEPRDAPSFVGDAGYMRFDKSPTEPIFPLQPVSATTPLERWAEAALGLGHVSIAFDRDGAPRYDYLALPFSGDFIPSMPVRAAAAYLGISWEQVGLVLGEGVNLGPITIPTDQSMRLLVNYRGPRGTFPTYSFLDLLEGRVQAAALSGRIVLVGAMAGTSATLPIHITMAKRLAIFGTVLRARNAEEKAAATAAFVRDVVPLLADARIAPVVDAVFPLDRVAEAYELVASDTTFGKVILDCR